MCRSGLFTFGAVFASDALLEAASKNISDILSQRAFSGRRVFNSASFSWSVNLFRICCVVGNALALGAACR